MNNDVDYTMLYPLVVCKSKGGPYNDASFVAGCYFGQIQAECKKLIECYKKVWCVPTPLIPQIELLVMHEGCEMSTELWIEHPDDWTFVTIQRQPTKSHKDLSDE